MSVKGDESLPMNLRTGSIVRVLDVEGFDRQIGEVVRHFQRNGSYEVEMTCGRRLCLRVSDLEVIRR